MPGRRVRTPRRETLERRTTGHPLLKLFVYGTLKRGQSNHDRFCRGALAVEEATLPGRLYDLPFGFPGLIVAGQSVRAVGTTDYAADARSSGRPAETADQDEGSSPVVYGELMTFDDPEERLPSIDGLEGYRPGEPGLYKRVLLPVEPSGKDANILAWAYAVESASGVHLPGGRWPAG